MHVVLLCCIVFGVVLANVFLRVDSSAEGALVIASFSSLVTCWYALVVLNILCVLGKVSTVCTVYRLGKLWIVDYKLHRFYCP